MIWKEIVNPNSELILDVFHFYDQIFPAEVREPQENGYVHFTDIHYVQPPLRIGSRSEIIQLDIECQ